MNSYPLVVVAAVVACMGCEHNDGVPLPPNDVRVVNVPDMGTNVDALPTVTFTGAVHGDDGVALTREEIFTEIQHVAQVVTWPSRASVPGTWEFMPSFDPDDDGWPDGAIEFVPAGPAAPGWEAVIVSPSALPANFDVPPTAPDRVVRYARTSWPIVTDIHAIRLSDEHPAPTGYPPPGPEHSYTLAVVFSEPVSSAVMIHSFVTIATSGCEPLRAFEPVDAPVDWAGYYCPRIEEDEAMQVRIAGGLRAAAGATVASAYGRPEDSEVVLDVVLSGDETQRAADRAVLAMAAGIALAAGDGP